MSYCINCGNKVEDAWDFCAECGTRIERNKVENRPVGEIPVSSIEEKKLESRPGEINQTAQVGNKVNFSIPLIGAILILLGFFLPWVVYYGQYTGLSIAKMTSRYSGGKDLHSLLAYLVPISACIFLIITQSGQSIPFVKFIRYIPMIALVLIAIFAIRRADGHEDMLSGYSGSSSIINMFRIGFIASLLGSILLLFPLSRKTVTI